MNRNENGVPCCPKCQSTHNYFVSESIEIIENGCLINMTRLCSPCNKTFLCIFPVMEKQEEVH